MRHPLFVTGAVGYLLVIAVGIGGYEVGLRGAVAFIAPLLASLTVSAFISARFGSLDALEDAVD